MNDTSRIKGLTSSSAPPQSPREEVPTVATDEIFDESRVRWVFDEHPLGFPLDPDNLEDGPRSGPMFGVCLHYVTENEFLRNSIWIDGLSKDAPEETINEAKDYLMDWLLEILGV